MSFRRFLILPAAGSLAAMLLVAHSAAADATTGTVVGRVLWSPCIRAIPLPAVPDAQVQPGQPAMPQPVPPQVNGLPAGAVLVAVQNTSVSARTDEAGRFSLTNVPAGQFLTIAAGPVADSVAATAERPNVFVNGGDRVDLGTLSLGASTTFPFACRVLPGVGAAQGADTTTPGAPAPPSDTGTITPDSSPTTPDTSAPQTP